MICDYISRQIFIDIFSFRFQQSVFLTTVLFSLLSFFLLFIHFCCNGIKGPWPDTVGLMNICFSL